MNKTHTTSPTFGVFFSNYDIQHAISNGTHTRFVLLPYASSTIFFALSDIDVSRPHK